MKAPIVVCDQAFVDASLVPPECLRAPGSCPAGVYETLLWDHGQASDWQEHLHRLTTGCRYLGISSSVYESVFTRQKVELLAEKNGLSNARARLRLMIYMQPQSLVNTAHVTFRCIAALWPAPVVQPPTKAFKCAVSPILRQAGDVSYKYKLLGRLQVDIDLAAARTAGLEDVLYYNSRDELCEASYSNVWLVKDGELYTPPVEAPCLPGIVRAKVIAAAEKQGILFHDDAVITKQCVAAADEIFLSSSIRGIQPVTGVEGMTSPSGMSESAILSVLREQVKI